MMRGRRRSTKRARKTGRISYFRQTPSGARNTYTQRGVESPAHRAGLSLYFATEGACLNWLDPNPNFSDHLLIELIPVGRPVARADALSGPRRGCGVETRLSAPSG